MIMDLSRRFNPYLPQRTAASQSDAITGMSRHMCHVNDAQQQMVGLSLLVRTLVIAHVLALFPLFELL